MTNSEHKYFRLDIVLRKMLLLAQNLQQQPEKYVKFYRYIIFAVGGAVLLVYYNKPRKILPIKNMITYRTQAPPNTFCFSFIDL